MWKKSVFIIEWQQWGTPTLFSFPVLPISCLGRAQVTEVYRHDPNTKLSEEKIEWTVLIHFMNVSKWARGGTAVYQGYAGVRQKSPCLDKNTQTDPGGGLKEKEKVTLICPLLNQAAFYSRVCNWQWWLFASKYFASEFITRRLFFHELKRARPLLIRLSQELVYLPSHSG